ncbi:7521_t:CDS:10, partial [Entrophospora sp. SA101]
TNSTMSSKKGKQLANKKPIKLTEERRRRLMSQKYAYSLLCNNMIVPPHVFAAMARDSEYEQSLEIYAKIYGCELDNTINSLKFLQASLKSSLSSTPETNSASTSSTLITTNYTTTNSSITNFIPILPEVLIKAQEQAELGAIEIRNRINERIKALENLPANLSNGPLKQRLTFDDNKRPASNPKLNAVIELKALRLYDFQQKIRNEIMQYSPMYRRPQGLDEILQYRRPKERFEYTWSYFHRREQDRIQKKINEEKAKRQKFFFQISAMYADYITISELMREKKLALGMAVLNYHSSVQKEQQRKQDKFQRERLNALKNDDEEAYMKLIDETKDTRLSHLLKQTDQYLESLAKAVSSQQNQNFDNNSTINAHNGPSISLSSSVIDEDNIIETRDGKKIDYYQVAHRIKEEVKQPSILKGGVLKEYQIKGLEWMVSLYNNRLNGILADEMGLGKTIQTISLITYLIEKKRQNGPFLIIYIDKLDGGIGKMGMKLIDETKDTRLSHLLKQTDQYLESLAKAVSSQQNQNFDNNSTINAHNGPSISLSSSVIDEDNIIETRDGKKIDYYQVAHRIKEEVKQPSILKGGVLKEYQIKGLEWMVSLYNNRLNGILADEMGLGKTIQTISLITYLIEKKRQNGPFLIIVPLSTLTNWMVELEKWAPDINKVVYKGTINERRSIQQRHLKHIDFQVFLTTYEYVIKDKQQLGKVKWLYVIVDEGHRMKNVNSKLSMNNLPELWSLLNFVLPKIFDSLESFDEWFNTPFANTGGQDKIALNEEETLLIIRRLHKVLRPFLLRRLKKDVESELPDKIEKIIKVKLSALQIKLYNQMKTHGAIFVNKGEKGKICNHPFVFKEVEKDINKSNSNNEYLYRVSGKFEFLDRILPKLIRTNHKILVFFQMTTIMDIMQDYFEWRGYSFLRLDGTTKSEDRTKLLGQFNAPASPYSIFMLSTRAGGLGLNLQTADTVIIFDSDWNPHQDLQAQDRAHRIGQKNEVKILRLISQKSIEENILARAQYKLDIDGKVIQAGKFDHKSTAQEREDYLRSLLEGGDNDETNETDENEVLDDDEINELLARGDDELTIFRKIDEEREKIEEREWLSSGSSSVRKGRLIEEHELPPLYLAEHEKIIKAENVEEYGRGQRQRKEVLYDDGLTEDQYLKALEKNMDGEEPEVKEQEDVELKPKKRYKKDRKDRKGKRKAEDVVNSEDEKPKKKIASDARSIRKAKQKATEGIHNNIQEELTTIEELKNMKKRSRRKRVDVKIGDDEDDNEIEENNRNVASSSSSSSQKIIQKDFVSGSLTTQSFSFHVFHQCIVYLESFIDKSDEKPRKRAELFLDLPNRKEYPSYYKVIKKPVSLNLLRKRINRGHYKSYDEFSNDMTLINYENYEVIITIGSRSIIGAIEHDG